MDLQTLYHVPTAWLISGALFVIMPSLSWLALQGMRSASIHVWTLGGMVLSAGLILSGLRGYTSAVWTFGPGAFFAYWGNALHASAMHMELKKQSNIAGFLAYSVFFVLIKEWLRHSYPDTDAHYLWLFGNMSALLGYTALLCWKLAVTEEISSPKWIAGVHLLMSLVFVYRGLKSLLDLGSANTMMSGADSVLTTIMVMMVAVISNVGLIGIYLERSTKQTIELKLKNQQQELDARLTQEIATVDRQRSMGELAAALTHELGQPVTGLLMESDSLKYELSSKSPSHEQLLKISSNIDRQADRASQILGGIRHFIRPRPKLMRPICLEETCRSVVDLLIPQDDQPQIHISCDRSHGKPIIMGDQVLMSQVFLNLVRNSLEARRSTEPIHVDIHFAVRGSWVEVTLSDNGKGLNTEVQPLVGTPFFTSKPEGLGIGISISKRIIDQHSGFWEMFNNTSVNVGTTTRMRFPLHPVDRQGIKEPAPAN